MAKLKQMLILSKTLYFDTTEILVYVRDHVPNIFAEVSLLLLLLSDVLSAF